MEKFSQFRDRGSGIAPFLPIPTGSSGWQLPLHLFLFCFRLPILLTISLSYFLILQWLPIGSLGKKASLWCILGVPGLWWSDLQVDGVKRGSLAKQHGTRLPDGSSIIASSFTSPIDAVYLAAVFDPIFTASYPNIKEVEHMSLFKAVWRSFVYPRASPSSRATLVTVGFLREAYPNRPIVIFGECTTTNGLGILPLSPSIVAAPANMKIYPVSIQYTPADVTTPLPGTYATFLWNLLSRPTHSIRMRIAESAVSNNTAIIHSVDRKPSSTNSSRTTRSDSNHVDQLGNGNSNLAGSALGGTGEITLTRDQKAVLDYVGGALARLGRVKRVGLGVKEKEEFVKAWARTRHQ